MDLTAALAGYLEERRLIRNAIRRLERRKVEAISATGVVAEIRTKRPISDAEGDGLHRLAAEYLRDKWGYL